MGRCDGCCRLRNQDCTTKWLIYSAIALLALGIIAAIVFPILRFAVRPHVEASIEDARLNSFAIAAAAAQTGTPPSSLLAYNVSVAISIHNPTGGFVKHTKPLVASLAFQDNRLCNISVAGKGHKYRPSKKEVHFLLASGEVPLDVLGAEAVEDFKKQNKSGEFKVEVRLYGEIAYLGLDAIGNLRNLGFSCPLSLPLAPPGHGVVLSHEVKCKPEPENIYF